MYTKHNTVPKYLMPSLLYNAHTQLQDITGRTTRHSYHVAMQYYLVIPDMRTRHGCLVDLARNLHRRQYKRPACD
jgi:hypothetical protein